MTDALVYPSVPLFLLGGWGLFELARAWRLVRLRRGGRAEGPVLRFLKWSLRPWAAWAAVNLVHRIWPHGWLCNARTFPFYANCLGTGFGTGIWGTLLRLWELQTFWRWTAVGVALSVGFCLLVLFACRRPPRSLRARIGLLLVFYLFAVALPLALNSIPFGATAPQGENSSLLEPWTDSGSTYLYGLLVVKDRPSHFMRHFAELQPRLKMTIHGVTHPPGATLLQYGIGHLFGVGHENPRLNTTRLRHAIGVAVLGGLGVVLVWLIARSLFSEGAAWLAAAFWVVLPGRLAYATFALDTLFAGFFALAFWLGWLVVTSGKMRWVPAVGLGAVFACLTMLTYSWCIAAAMFVVFGLCVARESKWRLRDLSLRLGLPLGVMTVLSGACLIVHRLNYLATYRAATDFMKSMHVCADALQWVVKLAGGQVDLWLMTGSTVCSVIVIALARALGGRHGLAQRALLFSVLGVYALPLLFGPNPVKMEAARLWHWIPVVPVAFAGDAVWREPRRSFFSVGAVAVSLLTFLVMKCFVSFAV